MNKITQCLLVVAAFAGFLAAATHSRAAEKNFMGVLPFVTSTDRVGFFDQRTGKIYIYDNNINQCLFIGQIQSLGKPIAAVSSTPTTTNL